MIDRTGQADFEVLTHRLRQEHIDTQRGANTQRGAPPVRMIDLARDPLALMARGRRSRDAPTWPDETFSTASP
jgi:hypothetical protein